MVVKLILRVAKGRVESICPVDVRRFMRGNSQVTIAYVWLLDETIVSYSIVSLSIGRINRQGTSLKWYNLLISDYTHIVGIFRLSCFFRSFVSLEL